MGSRPESLSTRIRVRAWLRRRGRWRWAAIAAAALAFVAFVVTAQQGFVFDDHWTVVKNRHLDGSLGSLLKASFEGRAAKLSIPDATRPTMIASLWMDRRLFGVSPVGHHLHSLVIHALCSALCALAALALTRRLAVALCAAALFAVAPIQAEAVASIHFREDLIAAAGAIGIIACLFSPKRVVPSLYVDLGVAATWLVALLAKESAFVLVVLLPALGSLVGGRRWFARNERALVFLGAVGLLWVNWRYGLTFGGDDIPRAARVDAWTRTCDTARFSVQALSSTLFPFLSRPEYPREAHASAWWLSVVPSLFTLVVVLSRMRRWRAVAAGLVVVVLAPLLASPLVGPINPRADRFLYASVFGAAVAWSVLGANLLGRRWLAAGTVLVVLVSVPLSWRAASSWADDRALWERAVETAPSSPRAWAALSRLARLRGDFREAERLISRALDIDPAYVPAHLTRLYNAVAAGDGLIASEELATIDRWGGGHAPAVERARRCAGLPQAEARACISTSD